MTEFVRWYCYNKRVLDEYDKYITYYSRPILTEDFMGYQYTGMNITLDTQEEMNIFLTRVTRLPSCVTYNVEDRSIIRVSYDWHMKCKQYLKSVKAKVKRDMDTCKLQFIFKTDKDRIEFMKKYPDMPNKYIECLVSA